MSRAIIGKSILFIYVSLLISVSLPAAEGAQLLAYKRMENIHAGSAGNAFRRFGRHAMVRAAHSKQLPEVRNYL